MERGRDESSTLDLALGSGREVGVCCLCHSLNEAVMSELGHTHKSLVQSWPSAAELSGVFLVCFVSSLKRCAVFKG